MKKRNNLPAEHSRKRQFLKKPNFPGGSEAFRAFISENLRFPKEALEAGVQGSVVVEYDILDTGEVQNPRVLNGPGHGCDEEALRVIGLLRFEKVKNRGVRLKITTKTTIHFNLPGVQITYSAPVKQEKKKEEKKDEAAVYSYTIFTQQPGS